MSARLVATMLTGAAMLAAGLVVAAPGNLRWQAHPGTACQDLAALQEAMDLSSLGDQAVIRARVVQLAAALTTGDDGDAATDLLGTALRLRVADDLQQVLDDPEATSSDLAAALAPLAAVCGIRLGF